MGHGEGYIYRGMKDSADQYAATGRIEQPCEQHAAGEQTDQPSNNVAKSHAYVTGAVKEERQMPTSPKQSKYQRCGKRTISALQNRQGKTAPADLLSYSKGDEVIKSKSGHLRKGHTNDCIPMPIPQH